MDIEEDTAHTQNTEDTPACEREGASESQNPHADPSSFQSDPPVEEPAAARAASASGGRKRSASDLSECSTSSSAKLSSAPKKRVALRHMLSTASSTNEGEGQAGRSQEEKDSDLLGEKPPAKVSTRIENDAKGDITMSQVLADTLGKATARNAKEDEAATPAATIGRKRSGSNQTNPVVVRPRPPSDAKASTEFMEGPTWDPSMPSHDGDRKKSAAEVSAASSTGAYFADETTMTMPMTMTTMTMDQPASSWDDEQSPPESPTTPIQVIVCQTVGTGIASLDLHNTLQQDQPHQKNLAMEKAATDAIRDALRKTSLHLHYTTDTANQDLTWNQGRSIAIQLGVPDLGIGGSSIDVSAACTPMWRPEQVSISSGIGGMYIDSANESSQTVPPTSTKGHVIVVASVTISEEQSDATAASTAASSLQMLSEAAPSPPTNDLPSRIELQRRLHQAESIIENLLTETQRQRTLQQEGLQKIDPVLPAAASSTANPNPPLKGQSQVTPTAADMDPDIEVRTYSSKVPSLHVHNPWNEHLPSQLPKVHEGASPNADDDDPSQSSSGRVSASSSTSSSTGSFAVTAPSAVPYPHTAVVAAGSAAASHIKLDQLVQIMDQEEQKNVEHNYHDYAMISDAFLNDQKGTFEKSQTDLMLMSKRNVCFPVKIMILIEDCHRRGLTDIVSWNSTGRAFRVYDHVRFEKEILPLYLESSKYSSFLRQLNLYSFRRFAGGVDKGHYYHERFLRGLPWIASTIQRTKINGRKSRKAGNPDAEPQLADYKALGPPPSDSPYWKLHQSLSNGVEGEAPVKQSKKKKM